MNNQLPLSLQAPESASFDNFIAGNNEQLIFSLLNQQEQFIFLWGENHSGKSHLLQALVEYYRSIGFNCLYIPLQINEDGSPSLSHELLYGLETMDLLCLDDIHNIAGEALWEEALFHFFNQIRDNKGRLVVSANANAVNLAIQLNDLKSRLSWGLTYQCQALSDDNKIKAIQLRAQQRGFNLSDEVTRYLLTHVSRSMPELIKLLDKLDYESLAEQRKISIPFIKKYLP